MKKEACENYLIKINVRGPFENEYELYLCYKPTVECHRNYIIFHHGIKSSYGSPKDYDVSVDAKAVDNLLWKIEKAKISPFHSGPIGCDGIGYSITFKKGFNKAHYEWWLKPPEGWEPLEEIINELNNLISSASLPSAKPHKNRISNPSNKTSGRARPQKPPKN